MIFAKLANFIDFRFLHVYVQSTFCFFVQFCFQNLGNGREVENGHRYNSFSFKNEKEPNFTKYFGNFFFHYQNKNSLSMSVFISSAITQILKTKFYGFWTQTCRNWTKLFTWICYFSQVSHYTTWDFPVLNSISA